MATGPFSIEQLLSSVRRSGHGSHQAKLNQETLTMLEDFAAYLVRSEGKSMSTARAYKSWCAKALVERGAHDSHVKSAVKALSRYWDNK